MVVDERPERVDVGPTDSLGRLERRAAGEDRQAREDVALALAEQVDAPRHRLAQRLLAGRKVARAAGEDTEPRIESRPQRPWSQGSDPCGGELDRQRQPVDAPADLAQVVCVAGVSRERRLEQARPLHEELDRVLLGQRRNRKDVLSRHVQNGAARRQHRQPRRPRREARKARSRFAHVLQVVDDEQQLL